MSVLGVIVVDTLFKSKNMEDTKHIQEVEEKNKFLRYQIDETNKIFGHNDQGCSLVDEVNEVIVM